MSLKQNDEYFENEMEHNFRVEEDEVDNTLDKIEEDKEQEDKHLEHLENNFGGGGGWKL